MESRQKKYHSTPKGKEALKKAQSKYDESDIERRRKQKENICDESVPKTQIIANGNKK